MAWVIPLFLAYIPGLVIGFMLFTLLITRYREPSLTAPNGDWPEGEWPSVTIVIAAWNESEAIVSTLGRIAELTYQGRVEVVVADNNSTDDTGALADAAAERLGLDYRRLFEQKQGKHHALNTALATVTTPLVVTVDADTHLQRESLTHCRASSPACSSGTIGSGSTASSACRPRTTRRPSPRVPSRATGRVTFGLSAALGSHRRW
jgi:biofilm PGA synthesis N-glycosyltransferase PgaC